MNDRVDAGKDASIRRLSEIEHGRFRHAFDLYRETRGASHRAAHAPAAMRQRGREMRADKAVDAGNENRLHESVRPTSVAIRIAFAIIVKLWFFDGSVGKFA